MTDPEALLLQGIGCTSVGRPCGKCLRASVKAEHSYLSLRPCGRKKKSEEQRTERMDQGRSEVHFRKRFVIFHPDLYISVASTCLSSTRCFLFIPVDLIPPTSLQHISSLLFLFSFGFDLLCFLYAPEFLLSRLSHLLAIIIFFLSVSVSRNRGAQ